MKPFAQAMKDTLMGIIDEMAADPRPFVRNPDTDFTRDRKLSFRDTIHLILSMGGSTLNQELLGYFLFNSLDTPTASAFVQQRTKILPDAFRHLFCRFRQATQPPQPGEGFLPVAADGTVTTFYCDPSDKECHIDNSSMKGYNAMHITALYALHTRAYSDAVIQGEAQKDEFRAFCDMVDRYPGSLAPRTIFIADRGFSSYNVFAHIMQKGAYFLIRTKDTTSNGIASRLDLPTSGGFDRTVHITLVRRQTNYFKSLPGARLIQKQVPFDFLEYGSNETYPMTLRFVRLMLPDGSYELLVTNLPADTFPPAELLRLYGMRWGMESSFRELKYSIGMSNYHCRKPQSVIQEIWARLTLYNFCEAIITHTAGEMAEEGRGDGKKKKYVYQINFTLAVRVCHRFLRTLPHENPPDVGALIRKYLLPVRPGRQFRRRMRFCHAVSFLYRIM